MIDIKTLACGPKHLVLRAIAAHRTTFMGERPRAVYMAEESLYELVQELIADGENFRVPRRSDGIDGVHYVEGIDYCGTQIRVGDAGGYPFMLCCNGHVFAL